MTELITMVQVEAQPRPKQTETWSPAKINPLILPRVANSPGSNFREPHRFDPLAALEYGRPLVAKRGKTFRGVDA